MESLQSIPDASVGFKIGNFYVETLQTKDNIVKTARISEIDRKRSTHNPKQLIYKWAGDAHLIQVIDAYQKL